MSATVLLRVVDSEYESPVLGTNECNDFEIALTLPMRTKLLYPFSTNKCKTLSTARFVKDDSMI